MSHIPPPTTLPVGSKVWAYLRDSGGESQEQSTLQQRTEIEAFCENFGLILIRVFEDIARSGGKSSGRLEFLEMINQSTFSERPNGLLIWNYARFARDMDDSAFYRALLRKNGMIVHSLTDPIPAGEFSKVIESLIDYANEEKRHQNSRDVKRALAERVKAGFSSGGFPPRGYLAKQEILGTKRNNQPRVGSRWVVDPDLGPLVALAFRLRTEGKSLREITEATGGRLYQNDNSWTTFFRNRSYLGIGKCKDLEIPDHHPALVDPATFSTVQEINQRAGSNLQGNLLHPRRLASPSLLSGLAACIHCGSAMVKNRSGNNKWHHYMCGKKARARYDSCEGRQVNAPKADQIILEATLSKILTPEFASEVIEEMKSQFSNAEELDRREQEIRSALSSIEKSIDKLLDAIEDTDSHTAKERLKLREIERARMLNEINDVQAQRGAGRLEISQEALAYTFDVWRGKIESARHTNDIRSQQNALRQFVKKIELGYGRARIWYSYPIHALYNTERGNAPVGAQRAIVRWFLFLESNEIISINERLSDCSHRDCAMVYNGPSHQLHKQNIRTALAGTGLLARSVRLVRHAGWPAHFQPPAFSTRADTLGVHGPVWFDARGLQFSVDILRSIQRGSCRDRTGVQLSCDDRGPKPHHFQGELQQGKDHLDWPEFHRYDLCLRRPRPGRLEIKSGRHCFRPAHGPAVCVL